MITIPTQKSHKKPYKDETVSEPGIFTDELPFPDKVVIESESEFFARVRAKLADSRPGLATPECTTISFESIEALAAVLTPKRRELMTAVKARQGFDSIESLAETLKRDRGSVSKDLKILSNSGLLLLATVASPGHGRRTEIKRVASSVKLELEI